MARKGKPHKGPRAVLVLGVALLFLIPFPILLYSAQTDTFWVSLEDHNRTDLETQQKQRDSLKSEQVQVYDWVGYLTNDQGNVTDLEFTIKASDGYNAMDLGYIEVRLPWCSMILGFPDITNPHGKVAVLQDPQGWSKQNMFGPGTTLRISFSGLNITPGEEGFLTIDYFPHGDGSHYYPPTEIKKMLSPVFSSGPLPLNPYIIPVTLRGGKYPDSNGSWIVNNLTIIENRTVLVNSDIIVQPGGTLLLRNSSLVFNSTQELLCKLTVLQGGDLQMRSSILISANTTIVDNVTARYSLVILGNATIEGSVIQYFNEIKLLSNGISIERTVIGAPRDGINATASNGLVNIQGASPHIRDSFFNTDMNLEGCNETLSGIRMKNHTLVITDSVVLLEKFEMVTSDWVDGGPFSFFIFSNSAVTVNDSSFIGPGSGISGSASWFSEVTLTVTHTFFDERGRDEGYSSSVVFNGGNIVFNENNVSNGKIGLDLARETQHFPITATVVGNTFINISIPVRAYNAQLMVKDNKFVNDPLYTYEPISDKISTLITIYSDSVIPIRPAYEFKRMSDDSVLYGFEESSPCKYTETLKSVHWCAGYSSEVSFIVVRFDGTKIDQSDYEVKLSSGLWEKTVRIKLTVGYQGLLYFIKISYGSFYPMLIFISAFYIMIAIIRGSKRKFNRMLDKKEKTDHEDMGIGKVEKGIGPATISHPIKGKRKGTLEPQKRPQRKKRHRPM
jgi:hypothetical protein